MHPKHQVGLALSKNALEGGDKVGLVTFPGGQVIIDGETLRNGRKYDIETMVLDEYAGQVTADHWDSLETLVGKVVNCRKDGNAVKIDGIQFAMNSASGRLAYDLMVDGFLTDVSVETYGPWPDESDDTYYKAKLIGLSVVVVGNSKSARIKELVANSLERSREAGLDTSKAEHAAQDVLASGKPKATESPAEPAASEAKAEQAKTPTPVAAPAHQAATSTKQDTQPVFKTAKNGRGFAVTVNYTNASGEKVTMELPDGGSIDVAENQLADVERQINQASAPAPDFQAQIAEAVEAATKPLNEKLAAMEQNGFEKLASEPEFKKAVHSVQRNGVKDYDSEFGAMSWQERGALAVNSAWAMLKNHDSEAALTLNKLNGFELARLKEEGIVANSMTLGDFGNFVTSPELIREIQGVRNDFSAILDATTWRETLSLEFGYLSRSGDINMQPVALGPTATSGAGANANRKPLSQYAATVRSSKLEELAAVTPVVNALTRFLAADILPDVAAGYRNDFDRKKAQLVIARLQQAANADAGARKVSPTTSAPIETVADLLKLWTKVSRTAPNGTFLMNVSTQARILEMALRSGVNGPLSEIFTTGTTPTLFGKKYIVVPDELLPTLGSNDTVSFAVKGDNAGDPETAVNVTIDSAIFFADLGTFTGRTSGGLQYDLSTEAAYEDGSTVKSAFQRNELLLRGAFFRGGAVQDVSKVASILTKAAA